MLVFQFFDFRDRHVVIHIFIKAFTIQLMIMPAKPTIASHQICQIMAKPNTVAKAAITIPAPLFFGI